MDSGVPSSTSLEATFPCPVCVNTMIPGAVRLNRATQGAGKVWVLDAGPPNLVDCPRCMGRGVLDNRRNRGDRRHGNRDRRD
jgi:hypothetical protein